MVSLSNKRLIRNILNDKVVIVTVLVLVVLLGMLLFRGCMLRSSVDRPPEINSKVHVLHK